MRLSREGEGFWVYVDMVLDMLMSWGLGLVDCLATVGMRVSLMLQRSGEARGVYGVCCCVGLGERSRCEWEGGWVGGALRGRGGWQ